MSDAFLVSKLTLTWSSKSSNAAIHPTILGSWLFFLSIQLVTWLVGWLVGVSSVFYCRWCFLVKDISFICKWYQWITIIHYERCMCDPQKTLSKMASSYCCWEHRQQKYIHTKNIIFRDVSYIKMEFLHIILIVCLHDGPYFLICGCLLSIFFSLFRLAVLVLFILICFQPFLSIYYLCVCCFHSKLHLYA